MRGRPGLCLFGLGFCSCGLLRRGSRRWRIGGGWGRGGCLVVLVVVGQDEGEEEHGEEEHVEEEEQREVVVVALLSWLEWNWLLGQRHLALGALLVSRGCSSHHLLMWMKVPRQRLPPAAMY